MTAILPDSASSGEADRYGATCVPDLKDAIAPHGSTGAARQLWAAAGWCQLPTDNYGYTDANGAHVNRIKNPGSLVGGQWFRHSSRDPEVLDEWGWLYPWGGIALDCGNSGVVVFDFDGDSLDDISDGGRPDIASALRTAQGRQYTRRNSERGHYPFALAKNHDGTLAEEFSDSAGAFGSWGDIRCHHGVIIAAPTPHPDALTKGGHYTAIPGPLTPLPDVLRACLGWNGDRSAEPPITDAELNTFLLGNDGCTNAVLLRAVIRKFHWRIDQNQSRHRALISCLGWAFEEACCGYYPAATALRELADAFAERFDTSGDGKRSAPDRDEVFNAAKWAASQVLQVDLDLRRKRITKLRTRT